MIAQGYALESVFGDSTCVSGLAATPYVTGLGVNIGRGQITQLMDIDDTSYGSIPPDTSDALLKQGINITSTPISLSAPTTGGYSQNFLIEAKLTESDSGSTVLPYYNSLNPSDPYSGPDNSGDAQNTLRIQRVTLQTKAGTPAPANTQNTPGVDAGWVPLYIVTVNAGQSTISPTQIARAANAPFVAQLTQVNKKLSGNTSIYVSPFGSDSNSGLLPGDALQTLQAASNKISASIDMNGFGITINLASSTAYAPAVFSGAPTGFGPNSYVKIVGSTAQIQSTAPQSAAIDVINGASVQVGSGIILKGTIGLQVYPGGTAAINGAVAFGDCTGPAILANGGAMSVLSSFEVNSGTAVLAAESQGTVYVGPGVTITSGGTPTYSNAVVSCIGPAYVQLASDMTWTGSFSGKKFDVSQNGVISSAGVGASLLPGTVTGTEESGGQFV
jgi:hypothetical protein